MFQQLIKPLRRIKLQRLSLFSSIEMISDLPPPISIVFNIFNFSFLFFFASQLQQTDSAASRIRELLSFQENKLGISLGVKRSFKINLKLIYSSFGGIFIGGCNGLSYVMNYVDKQEEEEEEGKSKREYEVVEERGVMVFVEESAIFYIAGTVMDYETTELSSHFSFINPNQKSECGCGESFNV